MLERYSEARLPTPYGEFRVVVYRTGQPGGLGATAVGLVDEEHVAMVLGDVAGSDVRTRVHSSCFTGEVLHSLRCDCRAQLDAALDKIGREGRGVLVYMVQEGRGIGLGNKVRAYQLQEQGKDTVEANLELGFAADSRSYAIAADILRDLGVTSVRLMTNNPAKRRGLEEAGMTVSALEPHHAGVTEHNAQYLEAKREKMGHLP
ncbi:MAG TPA: GTP cyclohydrolase II [Kofleriaceae bacterium]|nr:GTP cyclohydrolase II [Kofleriaceae bacterium]